MNWFHIDFTSDKVPDSVNQQLMADEEDRLDDQITKFC